MDKIKQWRRSKKLSLDEAGSLIGVSGVQWHRYEAGTRRIPAEKVILLSKATDVAPHELRPDVFPAAQAHPERAA